MIQVTKFDGSNYYINPHLIESMESNPDTTITLVGSKKIVVKSSVEDIIRAIIEYRRKIGISFSDDETIVEKGDTI